MSKVNAALGFVKNVISVGSNKQKGIYTEWLNGTTHTLNGKTAVYGIIQKGEDFAKRLFYMSDGNKQVSRIRSLYGTTDIGDTTKIITRGNAQVGKHNVKTFNRDTYTYGESGLGITHERVDNVFAGKKNIGGRKITTSIHENTTKPFTYKTFLDAQGNEIKTVYYNSFGVRSSAVYADGTRLCYDVHGLPVYSTRDGAPMDLGGIDTLF